MKQKSQKNEHIYKIIKQKYIYANFVNPQSNKNIKIITPMMKSVDFETRDYVRVVPAHMCHSE